MSRAILFCIAAVSCDVITTYTIVEMLGGIEVNPLIDNIIQLGWWLFFIIKYAGGVGVPLTYALIKKQKKMLMWSGWLHLTISLVNAVSLVAAQVVLF